MATNLEVVERMFDMVNNQKRVREAFELNVVENYIQHNPHLNNGREDAIKLIEGIVNTPGFAASVKRMIAEGDMVVVHMHIGFGGTAPDLAVVDIVRLEGGKIAEHWDVIQEVPARTVSGNPMV